MNKSLLTLVALSLTLTACHRTSREVWEDTKSAKRYVSKGFRSLLGRHVDSNLAYREGWGDDEEMLSLSDQDRYQQDPMGSSPSLSMNDFGQGIPLSKESPGDPGSPLPGIDGFKEPNGELSALFRKIHFETDNYTIRGKENLEVLETIANYLIKHPSTYVFVEGHADERGAAAYNLALGAKRANSIRTLLVQNGVNPDQLFTISYGKERPIVEAHDELGWKQNRRAEFKLYVR